jgi:hypothetical protein
MTTKYKYDWAGPLTAAAIIGGALFFTYFFGRC